MALPGESSSPFNLQVPDDQATEFGGELRRLTEILPDRINLDSASVEQGLVKLVLTLIEFIRRLLEKQAVRRMDGGGLSPEQIEELGLTLMRLEEKMRELEIQFGLSEGELNLDLGPLGRLI